jgi:hypothetical protein
VNPTLPRPAGEQDLDTVAPNFEHETFSVSAKFGPATCPSFFFCTIMASSAPGALLSDTLGALASEDGAGPSGGGDSAPAQGEHPASGPALSPAYIARLRAASFVSAKDAGRSLAQMSLPGQTLRQATDVALYDHPGYHAFKDHHRAIASLVDRMLLDFGPLACEFPCFQQALAELTALRMATNEWGPGPKAQPGVLEAADEVRIARVGNRLPVPGMDAFSKRAYEVSKYSKRG